MVKDLVKSLYNNISVPVTCKIRILPELDDTLEIANMMVENGATFLAVHGRTKEQKKQLQGKANWDFIKKIKENIKIPVFANGNIQYFKDI